MFFFCCVYLFLFFFSFEEGGEGASGCIGQKQHLSDTLHFVLIVVVTLVICVSAESSHVKGETSKSPFTPPSVPSANFSRHSSGEVGNPWLNAEQPGGRDLDV